MAEDVRDVYRERHGEDYLLRIAVMGISYDDAVAYCEWKTRTTHADWRLPTEFEHEKAARGVDGRTFPWGDREDWSLSKSEYSRAETPSPEPVGAFPTAASIYGMGDATGSVMEWTSSWYSKSRGTRAIKGTYWGHGLGYCGSRHALIRSRSNIVGFRCARSF